MAKIKVDINKYNSKYDIKNNKFINTIKPKLN